MTAYFGTEVNGESALAELQRTTVSRQINRAASIRKDETADYHAKRQTVRESGAPPKKTRPVASASKMTWITDLGRVVASETASAIAAARAGQTPGSRVRTSTVTKTGRTPVGGPFSA